MRLTLATGRDTVGQNVAYYAANLRIRKRLYKEAHRGGKSMTRRAIWLPLGLVAAAVIGLTGLFATDVQAGGGSATITIVPTPESCTPGQTDCNVDLTVTPTVGDVGALDVDINYDNTVLTATAASAPTCNPAFDADTIRCSLANLSGLTGVVSSITFTAIGADGATSPLALVISACTDTTGTDITCTPTDGTVNVQAATPTPAPTDTPAPTPTPAGQTPTPVGQTPAPTAGAGTATPGGLPPTGGDSGTSALPLLLAAIGIAALTAGAWAVTRLRGVRA
jgi:hypothetical protein